MLECLRAAPAAQRCGQNGDRDGDTGRHTGVLVPAGLDADEETHSRQFQWWFGGGANEAILEHYRPVLEAACRGELPWATTPRGRLALIIVLDQFSRTVWQGTPQAFAQDPAAQQLTLEGLACGHYAELATVWQKTFFVLPLGHAEQQGLLDRCVALCEALVHEAPAHLQRLYAFSASQARGHRDVVARFGRQPHRNAVLGRTSTADEVAYLAAGELVHRRSFQG
jgi:uncharacterized protein (DUF924 family)